MVKNWFFSLILISSQFIYVYNIYNVFRVYDTWYYDYRIPQIWKNLDRFIENRYLKRYLTLQSCCCIVPSSFYAIWSLVESCSIAIMPHLLILLFIHTTTGIYLRFVCEILKRPIRSKTPMKFRSKLYQ